MLCPVIFLGVHRSSPAKSKHSKEDRSGKHSINVWCFDPLPKVSAVLTTTCLMSANFSLHRERGKSKYSQRYSRWIFTGQSPAVLVLDLGDDFLLGLLDRRMSLRPRLPKNQVTTRASALFTEPSSSSARPFFNKTTTGRPTWSRWMVPAGNDL